jgi:hypothetical protein
MFDAAFRPAKTVASEFAPQCTAWMRPVSPRGLPCSTATASMTTSENAIATPTLSKSQRPGKTALAVPHDIASAAKPSPQAAGPR